MSFLEFLCTLVSFNLLAVSISQALIQYIFNICNFHLLKQVEMMRASLSKEGWQESQLLPPLWRFRRCKRGRNEFSFLTGEGLVFPSRVTLVAHMREQGYSEEDVENVNQLRKEMTKL